MQSCACIAEIVPLGCKRMLYGRVHAASVLHMAHMLVHCDGGLRDARIVEDVLELAMFLAAICHDFQHPGLNNDFLIQVRQAVLQASLHDCTWHSRLCAREQKGMHDCIFACCLRSRSLDGQYALQSHHPFAIQHNDRSPLENHHAAASFELLYRHLDNDSDEASSVPIIK